MSRAQRLLRGATAAVLTLLGAAGCLSAATTEEPNLPVMPAPGAVLSEDDVRSVLRRQGYTEAVRLIADEDGWIAVALCHGVQLIIELDEDGRTIFRSRSFRPARAAATSL